MARLSEEKIALIKATYKVVKTYSGTAKVVGCSPATVKKYVEEVETAKSAPILEKVKCSKAIPSSFQNCFDPNMNWADLCILSKEEKEEIYERKGEFR